MIVFVSSDIPPSPIDEDMIPATFIEQPKKNNCKICAKEFDTQDELKTHMLTHNGMLDLNIYYFPTQQSLLSVFLAF